MESQPLSEDVSAERTLATDATVQGVIDSLSGGHMVDRPVPEVAGALQRALMDAGLPEQPAPWVDATAGEIAGGRIVVADTRSQVDPQDAHGDGDDVPAVDGEPDETTDSARDGSGVRSGDRSGGSSGSSSGGSTAVGR